jgi:hypothetical protein
VFATTPYGDEVAILPKDRKRVVKEVEGGEKS